MIICTKQAANLALKKLYDDKDLFLQSVGGIVEAIQLDPKLPPQKEAYILTDTDLNNKRVCEAFKNSVAAKHPEAVVLVLVKGGKTRVDLPVSADESTFKIVYNCTPDTTALAIADAVKGTIEGKGGFVSSADVVPDISAYRPTIKVKEAPPTENVPIQIDTTKDETGVKMEDTIPPVDDSAITIQVSEEEQSAYLARLQACKSTADISAVAAELNAAGVIAELINSSADIKNMEIKMTALSNQIESIIIAPDGRSLESKLGSIRGLLYDKEFYNDKRTSLIEKRVTSIIDTLALQSIVLYQKEIEELNDKIKERKAGSSPETFNARLSSLLSERSSIIMKISSIVAEIETLSLVTDTMVKDTVKQITESSAVSIANPLIETRLRASGDMVVSEELLETVRRLLLKTEESNSDYQELNRQAVQLFESLSKVYEIDRDVINAQQELLEYMRSTSIEDTVVQSSILKKALRVFTGVEDSGLTIIPALLAEVKSATNVNVLNVYVNYDDKLSYYNINATPIDKFAEEMCTQNMMHVKADVNQEGMQKLLITLLKAYDYYKVINIVTGDLEFILNNFNDILSITTIVDASNPIKIDKAKVIIDSVKDLENVAKRVILNKTSFSEVNTTLHRLSLQDSIDFGVNNIPYIEQIALSGLHGVHPITMESVATKFKEYVNILGGK